MKPPDELKSWSKNGLIREVRRLRAILHEHSQHLGDTPQGEVGDMADVAGDPFAHGGVVLDTRRAVLMDRVDVCLMDPFTEGKPTTDVEKLPVALMLAGRINFTDDRSRQIFLFDGDGLAAIVTELLAVTERGGPEFEAFVARCIDARNEAMPRRPNDNNPEGGDSAMDQQEEQSGEPGTEPGAAAQGAADAAQGAADAAAAADETPEAEPEPGGEPGEPEAEPEPPADDDPEPEAA